MEGQKLNVTVAPKMVQITGEKQKDPVALEVWGQEYDFREELIVIKNLRADLSSETAFRFSGKVMDSSHIL